MTLDKLPIMRDFLRVTSLKVGDIKNQLEQLTPVINLCNNKDYNDIYCRIGDYESILKINGVMLEFDNENEVTLQSVMDTLSQFDDSGDIIVQSYNAKEAEYSTHGIIEVKVSCWFRPDVEVNDGSSRLFCEIKFV